MRFILTLLFIVFSVTGYAERSSLNDRIELTYPAVKSIDENAIVFISDELLTRFFEGSEIELQSVIFFSTSLSLFSLSDQNLSGFTLDQLNSYHLGVPSGMPEAVISSYLGGATASHYSTYYNKHQMVKALATRRVDIVLSEAIGVYQALELLDFRNKVERIVDLESIDARISIRASLPSATQDKIWGFVEQRIKTFDQRRVVENIFQQYDFDHDVIKIT